METTQTKTKVMILTASFRIKGFIELMPGARITDFMDDARDFVAVTDAEVYETGINLRHVTNVPFLDVARNHIQIVTPI